MSLISILLAIKLAMVVLICQDDADVPKLIQELEVVRDEDGFTSVEVDGAK